MAGGEAVEGVDGTEADDGFMASPVFVARSSLDAGGLLCVDLIQDPCASDVL